MNRNDKQFLMFQLYNETNFFSLNHLKYWLGLLVLTARYITRNARKTPTFPRCPTFVSGPTIVIYQPKEIAVTSRLTWITTTFSLPRPMRANELNEKETALFFMIP